jgi:acyl carrier protein
MKPAHPKETLMEPRTAILGRVTTVLSTELGVPAGEVTPTADLRDDLGMDSIDLVELVTGLEDQLGQRVAQDKLSDLRTIDDVVTLICDLTANHEEVG